MRVDVFQDHRDHLLGVAYRLLGSWSEAEDVVQDAWSRVADHDDIERARAFLTTVVTRLGVDQLRSARRRREVYVGPWLPEPLVGVAPPEDPRLSSSLSIATLVLLERLSPKERAAWLLREVFEQDTAEVAGVLQTSPANVRQLVRRARQHLDHAPRHDARAEDRQALFERLRAALDDGELEQLTSWLAEDAVGVSDGGGVVQAARVPIVGGERLGRALRGFRRLLPDSATMEVVWVNGDPGLVVGVDGAVFAVYAFILDGQGRVGRVYAVLAPDKLAGVSPRG